MDADEASQIFLSALDGSVVNANYARIATDFNGLELAPWISTSYYLASSSCQPLYGKLSDVFGRKRCILFSYSVFAFGCLLCGLAQDMPQFIGARVVQACGASGIGTLVTVLLSDLIPLKERAPWQGYLNMINAAGLSIGAPIGGLFADTIGWRWTFYCQVPLTSLAVLSVALFLRLPHSKIAEPGAKLRRIDFLGATLLVLSIISLLLGLDRASALSWSHLSCIVPLALAPVFLFAFILTELYFAVEPIIPGAVVRARTPLAVYVTNFFTFSGWSAFIFFVPLFYQAVDGVSSAQAGLRLLPAIICAVAGNVLGGHAIRHWGRYYAILIICGLGATLAMVPALVATWQTQEDIVLISLGIGLNSFFFGAMSLATLIALISTVLATEQATATATMFLARALGSAVSISLGGSLLQYELQTQLENALQGQNHGIDPTRIVEGVRRSLKFINALEPELQDIVRRGYAQAVRAVLWGVTGSFSAAWVTAWWIVEKKMS